jgi:protein SCO1/2
MFHYRRVSVLRIVALAVGSLFAALTVAAELNEHQDSQQETTHSSVVTVVLPNVSLQRADGQRITLPAALDDGRPVVLNFIYTSCSSICPLLSAVLAQFRDQLGAERAAVHIVSISIDPEQDTPQQLRAYAKRFKGGPGWDYFTSSVAASLQVQRAFGVYRGDKMSHTPVTFIRPAPGEPWTRIDGFATARQLVHSYRQLVAARR